MTYVHLRDYSVIAVDNDNRADNNTNCTSTDNVWHEYEFVYVYANNIS